MIKRTELRCPLCSSAHLVPGRQTFTEAGSYVNANDAAPVLAGSVGNSATLSCVSCGNVFKAGNADKEEVTVSGSTASTLSANKNRPEYSGAGRPGATSIHDPSLAEEVRQLLKKNMPVAAVKLVKDRTNLGLKECKDFIDRLRETVMSEATASYMQPGNTAGAMGTSVDSELDETVVQLLRENKKLEAIKAVKDQSDLDLKQCFEYVNRLQDAHNITVSQTGSINSRSVKGCFLATACYGDYDAPEVRILRHYRDTVLQQSVTGRAFIRFYYRMSPPLANAISRSATAQRFIREYVLQHLVQRVARQHSS